MKTTFNQLSLTSAFFITFSLIAYSGLPSANAQRQVAHQTPPYEYPQDFVNGYMSECKENFEIENAQEEKEIESLCTCALDQFRAKYTVDQLRQLSREDQEEVALSCLFE